MDNHTIANLLRRHAQELDAEGGNLYRVRAYRLAAQTVLEHDEPLTDLFERGGRRALRELPGVGSHIAEAIESLIRTGAMPERVTVPAA
jgi:DNA polymerase (family 10)